MELLYLLERLRNPVLDRLMQAVTELGGEITFLVLALILFWCVDKRQGYYLMAVGFLGTLTSQFLKITCRVPRPWVRDPAFTIVESARADATGYSFPSGHSQSAVATFGAIARCNEKKWLRFLCGVVCVLVPFSRMYLGVHYPSDVLFGAGLALGLVTLLHPVCFRDDGKHIPRLFAVLIALAAAFVLYVECFPFPADIDESNLASALENAYTLMGALLGMVIVYFVDEKKLHFPTEARWFAQIGKVLGGLILVVLVLYCLKAPLEALFHGHLITNALLYLMVVLAAGILWPMTFPWFSRLGNQS